MQKFSDPLLQTCPDCGSSVKKIMSLSAFSLKGTGWYTTDYKKTPPVKTEAKSDKPKAEEKPSSTPVSTITPAPTTAATAGAAVNVPKSS